MTAHRAFTLIELLMTLFLVGVVALVGTRTLVTLTRIWHDVPAAELRASTADRAAALLRADAWSADTLAVHGNTLTLTFDTDTVIWTRNPGGPLTRAAGGRLETFDVSMTPWVPRGVGISSRVGDVDVLLVSESQHLHGRTK